MKLIFKRADIVEGGYQTSPLVSVSAMVLALVAPHIDAVDKTFKLGFSFYSLNARTYRFSDSISSDLKEMSMAVETSILEALEELKG